MLVHMTELFNFRKKNITEIVFYQVFLSHGICASFSPMVSTMKQLKLLKQY